MEYRDVYDVKLKPRILEYLMNDQIPNEIDHSPQHCDLQRVVNAIRNLELLSESLPEEAINSGIVQDWALAVDSWVDRVLSLVSSPRTRKCWTGICLLGVTCQECSFNRLLAMYPVWFDKLLANIQPASDYISVKVATFASLSNLLKRLGRYSEVKKDVTAQAGKLIQPVLELLLDNEFSEVVLEGALSVLSTIIDFFPASFLPHYEKAEAIIVSKIIQGRCSSSMMKSYAYFLASLPKAKGEKDSWFVMMQDLLTSIEIHLNDVFHGLEQGIDPLAPERAAYLEARKSKQLLTCKIPTLMLCCSTMLTNSYPVPVTVPVYQLLSLVKRVLMLHGSFSQASLRSMAIMHEGFVCTELPVLQSCGLDLLAAIIKGTSSQLLPHAGSIIRLLKDCFQKCSLPVLRTKLYLIMRTLLISMGIGAALHIAEELISNAFLDLDASHYGFSLHLKFATVEASMQPAYRKRKHAATDYQEVHVPKKFSNHPISLKIATLNALETLLTMGGVLRSDLRLSIDNLLINVAENAYNGKWTSDEESELMSPNANGPSFADFLLAALHALLASLLSQPSVSQHHLAKGLELFRKGKQEAGTKVGDFCALALMASEMLMSQRKVSAAEIPSTSHACFNEGIQGELSENLYFPTENETLNSTPAGMISPNQDDALFNYLLDNYNDSEATLNNPDIGIAEEPSRMNSKELAVEEEEEEEEEYQEADHIPMLDVKFPGKEDQQGVQFLVNVDMEGNLDDILQNQQFPGSLSVADVKPFTDVKKGPESEIKRVVLDSSISCDFLDMAEVGNGTEAEELPATQFQEKTEGSYSGELAAK